MTAYPEVIYRPGGTAANNVFTTWATALASAQGYGKSRILIDSSLAAATVPSGTHHLGGSIRLAPFSVGYVGLTTPQATLTILDGGTLLDCEGIEGSMTLQCTCTTTKALDFTWGIGEVWFSVRDGATLQMLSGATVAACQIPQPVTGSVLGELDLLLNFCPVLDASATPGVPLFALMSTNASLTSCLGVAAYSGLTVYGDIVSGNAGTKSQVIWDTDSSIPPFASSLFSGTYTPIFESSAARNAYIPTVATGWNGAAPTNIRQGLDRVAAALNSLGVKP